MQGEISELKRFENSVPTQGGGAWNPSGCSDPNLIRVYPPVPKVRQNDTPNVA
jgi:hypothetical protein